MTIKNAITLFVITCILCVAFYFIKDSIKTSTKEALQYQVSIDSLNTQIDSLNHDIFHKQMTIGRYEVALEILKEQDPKAASKFELILHTETE